MSFLWLKYLKRSEECCLSGDENRVKPSEKQVLQFSGTQQKFSGHTAEKFTWSQIKNLVID